MISALATFWMAGNILAAGGKLPTHHYAESVVTSTTLMFLSQTAQLCERICSVQSRIICLPRSGLDGDTKNRVLLLSGLSGLSELENVCGSLLHPQPLVSRHLHLLARKPQVPHGGIRKSRVLMFKAGCFSVFVFRLLPLILSGCS